MSNEHFCQISVFLCFYQPWEKKYIHPEYKKYLEADFKLEEPCTDVFWFPLFSAQFCWDLIDEVEQFGLWSGGKHDVSHEF